LVQWQEQGAVTGLTIGQRDLSDKFRIPDRLYGRELAVQELLDACARIAQGRSELILVAGSSGIGKTAVINQVHQPITRQQGYLITGKFDQFNRDLPLAAVVQAVRDLIAQLLSATDLQLSAWKNDLAAALGANGQVLIDVIPQLEQIIGKQAPVPPLTGTAAQNRFNRLFQKFVEVFTTPAHPLVLCLDDLQWADPASLQTIELLMKGNGYLLILGAYRDREVSPDHPLISMVARLQQAEKVVQTITLKPLTSNDIDRLVADTLHCSTDSAKPLTELIALKTQGNPFFITQFLQALSTDGAIRFTRRTAAADLRIGSNWGWEWDLERVQALALTDDVVEFMVVQLQRLPPATQNLLKLAAWRLSPHNPLSRQQPSSGQDCKLA
jgi:predicted ATPase